MTKSQLLDSILANLNKLDKEDLSILYGPALNKQTFPSYTKEEITAFVVDTQRIIKGLISQWEIFKNVSPNILSPLNQQLVSAAQHFDGFKSLKINQITTHHHNVINPLLNFIDHVRQSNMYGILTPSFNILDHEKKFKALNESADELVKEAKEKTEIIRSLIPEATAISLSESLHKRALEIEKRVRNWQYATFAILLLAFILSATFLLVDKTPSLNLDNPNYKIQYNSNDLTFAYWLKRILVFSPIFYLIVFCIKQYNRERKLLEIYTHKRSIGQSLPAYIEQASNDETKNEILLRGATMIFTLPENPDTPVQGSDGVGTSEIKDLLEIRKHLEQK